MNVLVTAASRHGSTMEIATILGRILEDAGIDTDIKRPDDVRSWRATTASSSAVLSTWAAGSSPRDS